MQYYWTKKTRKSDASGKQQRRIPEIARHAGAGAERERSPQWAERGKKIVMGTIRSHQETNDKQ